MIKPPALICDLDNTLVFIPNYGINHYEAKKALLYFANKPMKEIVTAYQEDHSILIVTCRPLSNRGSTKEWLRLQGIKYTELLMRADFDIRPDHEVKQDTAQKLLQKYNIRFAYDDKQSVREMYNQLGIPTPQIPRG